MHATAKKILEGIREGKRIIDIKKEVNIGNSTVHKHLNNLLRDGFLKYYPRRWEVTEIGEKLFGEDKA